MRDPGGASTGVPSWPGSHLPNGAKGSQGLATGNPAPLFPKHFRVLDSLGVKPEGLVLWTDRQTEAQGEEVTKHLGLEQREPWKRVSTLGTAPGAPSDLE